MTTVLASAFVLAMLAGTVRTIRLNLIRRPALQARRFIATPFRVLESLLWIGCLLALILGVPHPVFLLIVALSIASIVTAWRFRYLEEKHSLNRWIRFAAQSGASVPELLDNLADDCRSGIAGRAKACSLRLYRGESFPDAARRSKLPIESDTLALVMAPEIQWSPMSGTGARSECSSQAWRPEKINAMGSTSLLMQNVTYVIFILFLAWGIASLVRKLLLPLLEGLTEDFFNRGTLHEWAIETASTVGNVFILVVTIWLTLALLIRWMPLWTVPLVPWFGRSAINRWRCEALSALERGMCVGEAEAEILRGLARMSRVRWIRRRSRSTANAVDSGLPLPDAMRRSRLITSKEQAWLTCANKNENLIGAIRRLRQDIERHQAIRWRIRISWVVPLVTILVAAYVLTHAIFLFHFLYTLIQNIN